MGKTNSIHLNKLPEHLGTFLAKVAKREGRSRRQTVLILLEAGLKQFEQCECKNVSEFMDILNITVPKYEKE